MNYKIYSSVKRIFDLVFSLLFLIVFAPLFILIALIIKLESKGPIFFHQTRIGKSGKNFTILKFRSMYENSPKYAYTPIDDKLDPRVTKFGHILRKSGIDEVPQLINVLKGEMSLVGPRPEMPFIVKNYLKHEKKRLEVLPGITCLWQIDQSVHKQPIHKNVHLDLQYIQKQSLLLDLEIILKTGIFFFKQIISSGAKKIYLKKVRSNSYNKLNKNKELKRKGNYYN